jgi:hypothetical protein
MPRGIPGSGPYAKKNKTAKKSTGRKVTKTTKSAAPRTAKKPSKKSAKKAE